MATCTSLCTGESERDKMNIVQISRWSIAYHIRNERQVRRRSVSGYAMRCLECIAAGNPPY